MKIAIIGPAHPLRGGIANFNEALAFALQNASHEVQIFSFSMQYPKILFPGKTQITNAPAPKDLKIRSLINSVSPFSWVKTHRKIKEFNPDLVVVRFWLPFMGPSLGTICGKLKKAGIPVIAITDNVIPHEKRKGDRLFTRYFLKRCDGFVVMAKSVEQDLRTFLKDPKVVYAPHPVYNLFGDAVSRSEAIAALSLNTNRKYILFFGLVRKYKGLHLLLDAFAMIKDKFQDVDLLVAGEFYEKPEAYYQQIEEHGMLHRVIIHNRYIPEAEVKLYFSTCNILAQTYLSATQSGVTQIGYHFGTPMLVTKVGGLPEIIEHGKSGYVSEVSALDVAASLSDFFENQREDAMRSEVKMAAGQFDWQYFVDKLLLMAKELQSS